MRTYTESEAASASGVSPDTIRLLLRRAVLPARYLEGRWLLEEAAVELLLDLVEREDPAWESLALDMAHR